MDVIPFIDDYNVCIVLVKDSIECMTRKNVIAQISVDDINSIDRLLSGIYGRNIAEDGSVYFPDEINPKKLADFLWNPCKYSCTKEIMYAYICRFAQRRINELYRDIRQKHTVGITISFTDSKILNKNQRQRAIKISNNKAELRRKENCRQLRGL